MRALTVVMTLVPAVALAQGPFEWRLDLRQATSPLETGPGYQSRPTMAMGAGVALGDHASEGMRIAFSIEGTLYHVAVRGKDSFSPSHFTWHETPSVVRTQVRVSVPAFRRTWRLETSVGVQRWFEDPTNFSCWCGPDPVRRRAVSPVLAAGVVRDLEGRRLSVTAGAAWSRHFHRPSTELVLGVAAR